MEKEYPRSIGIFTLDQELGIRSWDESMERITGIRASDVVGRHLTDLHPRLKEGPLLDRFRRALSGSTEIFSPVLHKYLIPCPPPEGSKYFERMRQKVSITPLLEEGKISGLLVTVEDVTLRMEWEREMARLLKEGDEEERVEAAKALSREAETVTQYLVDSIGDESWRVRQIAIKALSGKATNEITQRLLYILRQQHGDIRALNSVLQILSLSQEEVLESLLGLLKDSDPEVRMYSSMVLGERRDRKAIPYLIEALRDEDKNVVYHVVEALGKLRASEAVDQLTEMAFSKDFFLSFPAIQALSQIGESSVAARLVPLLKDELLKTAVAEALGNLGDLSVVGPLVGLLNEGAAPPAIIAEALWSISERYKRRLREDQVPELVASQIDQRGIEALVRSLNLKAAGEMHAVVKVLGWVHSPKAREALTRLLGDPELSKEVVESLVRMGDEVLEDLVAQLQSRDMDVKRTAVIALGRIGGARAVEPLIRILKEQPDLIQVTAGALAKIGDRRAFEPLLSFLGHEDPGVRISVIGALNSIGHPDMGEKMKGLLKDPDPLIRSSACSISGYFGYPQCVDGVLACIQDPSEEVRRVAVEQLPYLEDPRAVEALKAALKDPSARVRASAVKAMGEMETEGLLPLLEACLEDQSPWVRYFAIKSLMKKRALDIDRMYGMASKDPAGQVRIQAIKAIGEIGDLRGLGFLLQLKDSEDEDIAHTSLDALGRLNHPKAHEVLKDSLKSSDPDKRIIAARAIARSGIRDRVFLLHALAASDMDQKVLKEALSGLGQMRDQESISALLSLSTDPKTKDMAVEILVGLGEGIIDQLRALIHGLGRHSRLVLIEVLQAMARPAATELLAHFLRDPDWEVRKKAVTSLGEIGSRAFEDKILMLAHKDENPGVRLAAKKALQDLSTSRKWG